MDKERSAGLGAEPSLLPAQVFLRSEPSFLKGEQQSMTAIEDSQLTDRQRCLPHWYFTLHNTGFSTQLIAHTQLLLLFLYFLRNLGLEFRNESFKQPRKPTASQISRSSEHTLIPGTLAALSHQVGASNFETNRTTKEKREKRKHKRYF